MREYRLRKHAEQDLDDILDYTAKHFGEQQAGRLADNLFQAFETLVQFPLIGSECGRYRAGVRRFVLDAHVVYYRVDSSCIRILRILGPGQDPARHL